MRLKQEDEIDEIGFFWEPETPEERLPGRLIIKDGKKMELELWTCPDRKITIIGQLKSGRRVLLDDCLLTKNCFFLVHRAMISSMEIPETFWTKEEQLFKKVSFGVDGLNYWLGGGNSYISREPSGKADIEDKTFAFTRPADILLNIKKGMRLRIKRYWNHNEQESTNLKFFARSMTSSFCLEAEKPEKLEDFEKAVFGLTFLLQVAYGHLVSPAGPLVLNADNFKAQISDGTKGHVAIKYYCLSRVYPHCEPKISERLFSYWDLAEKGPADRISNFLGKRVDLGIAGYAYGKALSDINVYDKFLELTRGIECLYVVAQAPPGPPLPLKWALAKLFQALKVNGTTPFKLSEEDMNPENKKGFVRQVNCFRNDLTHHFPNRPIAPPAGPDKLIAINFTLEVLYQLTFLRLCGFTEEKILALCKECLWIKEKLNLCSEPSWDLGLDDRP